MARRRDRWEEEDDQRTIADMSGISRPNPFGFGPPEDIRRKPAGRSGSPEQPELNREERSAAVWGAMKAALLVGAAYIVGLGAVIGLMVLFWR